MTSRLLTNVPLSGVRGADFIVGIYSRAYTEHIQQQKPANLGLRIQQRAPLLVNPRQQCATWLSS